MTRGRPRRLWRLVIALLATALLGALPLLAQGLERTYLPTLGRAIEPEPEVAPQALRIVTVVLRGPSSSFNSDEYVQIRNVSSGPIDLGGLRLSGAREFPRAQPYVFPATTLPPGASALVFSRVGNDNPDANLFYLDSQDDVWEAGRAADLRDTQDRLLSRFVISGSDQPTPTATVTRPLPPVELNDIVLRDPAFPDISEEYTQLRNTGTSPVNLQGWRLRNASRPEVPDFVFPAFSLGGDLTITVFTTVGEDDLTIGDFYWDQTSDVWRVGDRAELRDFQGRLISFLIVPNQNQ